ncbi:unnamed protein product [Heligmosomoides polygyrus]|uniref:WGS project CAEQ00000000 data, annotated contig n=1 Tax=Heligmosomoides polygyrus TaxID=6339 RepID=A0A183GMS6_HELPZ|nr:unnamed protein product [Heligmosomoides polygyrus]
MAQQAMKNRYPWKLITGCGNGRSEGPTSDGKQVSVEAHHRVWKRQFFSPFPHPVMSPLMSFHGYRFHMVSMEAHQRVWTRRKRWPNKEHGKHGIRGRSSQGVETPEAMTQQGARLVSFRESSSRGASTTGVVAQQSVWTRQKRWSNKEHGKHGIRGSSSEGVDTAEAMAQQGARQAWYPRKLIRGCGHGSFFPFPHLVMSPLMSFHGYRFHMVSVEAHQRVSRKLTSRASC